MLIRIRVLMIISKDSNSHMLFSRMFTVVVIFHALLMTKMATKKKMKHVKSSTKMQPSVNHTMGLQGLIIIAQIKQRTKRLSVTLFPKSKKVHMMLRLVKSSCKETERSSVVVQVPLVGRNLHLLYLYWVLLVLQFMLPRSILHLLKVPKLISANKVVRWLKCTSLLPVECLSSTFIFICL